MSVSVEMKVNKDVFKKLKALPHETAKKTARRMLNKGTKMLISAATPKVPVGESRTGRKAGKKHLRDTVGRSPLRKYHNGQLVMVAAGPQWPEGAHGHLVEYGHDVKGGGGFGGRTRAQPFMRPAYDGSVGAIWLAQVKIAKRAINRHLKSIKEIR